VNPHVRRRLARLAGERRVRTCRQPFVAVTDRCLSVQWRPKKQLDGAPPARRKLAPLSGSGALGCHPCGHQSLAGAIALGLSELADTVEGGDSMGATLSVVGVPWLVHRALGGEMIDCPTGLHSPGAVGLHLDCGRVAGLSIIAAMLSAPSLGTA
jgi:hypothetical protein